MLFRSLQLYRISCLSALHKLTYDFARELVVAICAAVVLGTFFYVFNDFLNVQIETVSPDMRLAFAKAAALVSLLIATGFGVRMSRSEWWDEDSLSSTARRLGEAPNAVRLYQTLKTITIFCIVFCCAWFINIRYLHYWTLSTNVALQTGLLGLSIVFLLIRPRPQTPAQSTTSRFLERSSGGESTTLALWRLKQIYSRNRLTRLCLLAATLLLFLTVALMAQQAPLFVCFLSCLIVGFFLAMTLAFQLQEDLSYAWAERGMGISHATFVRAFEYLGLWNGLIWGLAAAGFYVVLSGGSLGLAAMLDHAGKLVVSIGLGSLLMPHIMFQIDPHKPAIQAVLVVLISLFIGTAVFASWLGLLLIPAFRYYAAAHQEGRFYRA